MPLPIVVALGHRFASLATEREVLAGVAEVVDANTVAAEQRRQILTQAAAVLLGTQDRLEPATIATMSRCQVIVRYGVGVDNVAIDRATRQGIPVANVTEYAIEEVSDHALALLLAASRRLVPSNLAARSGEWRTSLMAGVTRLSTQTVGIIGFGRIGQALARKIAALVARVIAYDPVVTADDVATRGVEPVDLPQLLRVSDFVSIHCPLTPQTRALINGETLALMKPTAWLINTARGEIVDEQALAAAIGSERIGGAALDVMAEEPPAPNSPLLQLPNVVLTPHVAYFSQQAIADLQRLAAEEARRVLSGGRPRSPVNPEVFGGGVG